MSAEPSKVIHIRNVGADITEPELHQLAHQFGPVQKVVMIRTKNQALLQLTEKQSAIRMVQFYSEVQPSIRGRPVYIQFSSHQELTSPDVVAPGRRPGEQDQQPNRILLVTIHNPLYPINVEVVHQVFSPYGFVEKIVTFSKSAGLQALVQFAVQQHATQARNALQGRNIYDGCCTLDIQFSNLQELQVNFNNERTRDYTNAQLPEAGGRGAPQMAQLVQGSLFGEGGGNMFAMHPGHAARPGFHPAPPGRQINSFVQLPDMNLAASFGGGLPPGVTGMNNRSNLLVSNLSTENMNPDKLFNLFSNYGNVLRIKMLHAKPDHALVQMADGLQAELAVTFLKGVTLYGKRMEVNYSNHPHINPSPDTRDFSASSLNRFSRSGPKNFRHCCAPTRMVHCSSLPADITADGISEHLAQHGATVVGAKVFEKDGKKQALVLFGSVEEATEALVCEHAQPLRGCIVRLAFSKSTVL